MASSWNISKSEGKEQRPPKSWTVNQLRFAMSIPGRHTPYLAERIRLGVLFLDLFPLPLYTSGASWAPVQKEGTTGHQRKRKELVGGLFLGEFSKPSGEAPRHTVFAYLALQPTSTRLVTVTGIYFHYHLWALTGTWSELDFRSWRGLLRALPQLSLADFNPLSGIGTGLRNTPEQAQGLLLRGLGRSLVWHTSQNPCKLPTNLREPETSLVPSTLFKEQRRGILIIVA